MSKKKAASVLLAGCLIGSNVVPAFAAGNTGLLLHTGSTEIRVKVGDGKTRKNVTDIMAMPMVGDGMGMPANAVWDETAQEFVIENTEQSTTFVLSWKDEHLDDFYMATVQVESDGTAKLTLMGEENPPVEESKVSMKTTALDFSDLSLPPMIELENTAGTLLSEYMLSASQTQKTPVKGVTLTDLLAFLGSIGVQWDEATPLPATVYLWHNETCLGGLSVTGATVEEDSVANHLSIPAGAGLLFSYAYNQTNINAVDNDLKLNLDLEDSSKFEGDKLLLSASKDTPAALSGLTISDVSVAGGKVSMKVTGTYESVKDLETVHLFYGTDYIGSVDVSVVVSAKPTFTLGADKLVKLVFAYNAAETDTASDTVDLVTNHQVDPAKLQLRANKDAEEPLNASFSATNTVITVTLNKGFADGTYALFYDGEHLGDIQVQKTVSEAPDTTVSVLGNSLNYEFPYLAAASDKQTDKLMLNIVNPKNEAISIADFEIKEQKPDGTFNDTTLLTIESFNAEDNSLTVSLMRGTEESAPQMPVMLLFRGKAVSEQPVYVTSMIMPNQDPYLVESIHEIMAQSYDTNEDGTPDADIPYNAEYAEDNDKKAAFIQSTVQTWMDSVAQMDGYADWAGAKIAITYDAEAGCFKSTISIRDTISNAKTWNVTMKAKPVEDTLPAVDIASITMKRTAAQKITFSFGTGTTAATEAVIQIENPEIAVVSAEKITADTEEKVLTITGKQKGETKVKIIFNDTAQTTVEIPVTIQPIMYKISASAGSNGSIACLTEGFDGLAEEGQSLKFEIKPDSGYRVSELLVDGESKDKVLSYELTDIQKDHTISVAFEKIPSAPIFIGGGGGGGGSSSSSSTNKKPAVSANKGGSVTVMKNNKTCVITPEKGYIIKDVIANGKSVGSVEVYEFKTASKSNTLKVEFAKAEVQKPESYTSKFTDIAGHWAKDAIQTFEKNGWVNGISDTIFAPEMGMTRGMFVTILGRMNQVEAGAVASEFVDVEPGKYYTGYIQWAYEAGIVSGVGNNRFAPNRNITREEMAVMVNNYLKTKGYKPTERDDIAFQDEHEISDWAKSAVHHLARCGIVAGKDNNRYDAHAGATRAELVAILNRVNNLK